MFQISKKYDLRRIICIRPYIFKEHFILYFFSLIETNILTILKKKEELPGTDYLCGHVDNSLK